MMNEILKSTLARSHNGERISLLELTHWFGTLEAVNCTFMLGPWDGGVFSTGHPGESLLVQSGWSGKRFDGAEEVAPIVCRDAQGRRVVSDMMGAARLRMIAAPGDTTPTAAMVYDKHPIIDHFKRIDADTVLGVMDRKGDTFPLYFYLQRES